jgi:hypothetical protein
MGKLTKAQQRMLRSVADLCVFAHFDIYEGYWWTERSKRLPAYGKSENFPPLPIRALLENGMIARGETARPVSGRHITPYELTDAGRAALAAATGGGK